VIAGDPVHVTQRTFRALLAALAHPGRIVHIDGTVDAPAGVSAALAAAAFALLDRDVRVWLAPHAAEEISAWLVALTRCRLTSSPADADFALILDACDALPLERWNPGTLLDPEHSVTLLVALEALAGGFTTHLTGPGIERSISVAPCGLPHRFWPQWAANAERYPRGVDCFFFDARSVMGLPRTAVGSLG
jgi:alpha-D-ribose 1-methylphosphonate 5-triphosphate synthase subunit PhnH